MKNRTYILEFRGIVERTYRCWPHVFRRLYSEWIIRTDEGRDCERIVTGKGSFLDQLLFKLCPEMETQLSEEQYRILKACFRHPRKWKKYSEALRTRNPWRVLEETTKRWRLMDALEG